jgi:hypothetical protein
VRTVRVINNINPVQNLSPAKFNSWRNAGAGVQGRAIIVNVRPNQVPDMHAMKMSLSDVLTGEPFPSNQPFSIVFKLSAIEFVAIEKAVLQLWSLGICHCDLHDSNIMLDTLSALMPHQNLNPITHAPIREYNSDGDFLRRMYFYVNPRELPKIPKANNAWWKETP